MSKICKLSWSRQQEIKHGFNWITKERHNEKEREFREGKLNTWMTINGVFSFLHLSKKTLCSQSQHFSSRLLGLLNYRHEWRKPHCTFSLSQLKQCSFKPYMHEWESWENIWFCAFTQWIFMYFPPQPLAKFFHCPGCGRGPRKIIIPDWGWTGAPVDHYPEFTLKKKQKIIKKKTDIQNV